MKKGQEKKVENCIKNEGKCMKIASLTVFAGGKTESPRCGEGEGEYSKCTIYIPVRGNVLHEQRSVAINICSPFINIYHIYTCIYI